MKELRSDGKKELRIGSIAIWMVIELGVVALLGMMRGYAQPGYEVEVQEARGEVRDERVWEEFKGLLRQAVEHIKVGDYVNAIVICQRVIEDKRADGYTRGWAYYRMGEALEGVDDIGAMNAYIRGIVQSMHPQIIREGSVYIGRRFGIVDIVGAYKGVVGERGMEELSMVLKLHEAYQRQFSGAKGEAIKIYDDVANDKGAPIGVRVVAYAEAAVIKLEAGDIEGAMERAKEGINLAESGKVSFGYGRYVYGRVKERMGDIEGAMKEYWKVVEDEMSEGIGLKGSVKRLWGRMKVQKVGDEWRGYIKRLKLMIERVEDEAIAGEMQVKVGEVYESKGEYEYARKAYEEALKKWYGDRIWWGARLRNKIGDMYFKDGDFTNAERVYSELIQAYEGIDVVEGEVLQAKIGLCAVYRAQGNTTKASQLWDKVKAQMSELAKRDSPLLRGVVAKAVELLVGENVLSQGDFHQIKARVEALGIKDKHIKSQIWMGIAYAHLRKHRYAQAKQTFEVVCAISKDTPRYLEALTRLGFLSIREGKVSEAVQCVKEIALHSDRLRDILPLFSNLCVATARTLLKHNNAFEAINLVRNVLKRVKFPRLQAAQLQSVLAAAYYDDGDYETALDKFRDIMNDDHLPADMRAAAGLRCAYILEDMRDLEGAKNQLNLVIRQYPHVHRIHAIALADLQFLKVMESTGAEAKRREPSIRTAIEKTRAALNRLPKHDPARVTLQMRIAHYHAILGEYDKALEEFSKVPPGRGSDPDMDARIFVPRSMAHILAYRYGDLKQAKDVLLKAIEQYAQAEDVVKQLTIELRKIELTIDFDLLHTETWRLYRQSLLPER